MLKRLACALALCLFLPSIAAAQLPQTDASGTARLAYVSPQRVAWADPSLDITTDVIAIVNQP
jgi:Skp family chaperone for outer membrane proteins